LKKVTKLRKKGIKTEKVREQEINRRRENEKLVKG
jgi:hypothetical protein